VANARITITDDLIDEITGIAGPILAMMIGIDVIIAVTTAAMTGATTTVAMSTMTSEETTGVTVVRIAITTSITISEMIHMTTDVARTTTIARKTTERNEFHHHRPKGATPTVHSIRPTARSTSSSTVAKQSKPTDRPNQTPGRSGMSTPETHDLYVGLNSQ
jgi:hypothetical protein